MIPAVSKVENDRLFMNKTMHWNLLPETEAMPNRLLNLYEKASAHAEDGETVLPISEWTPPMDILESDKEYVIKTELPGVRREDVRVTVENGLLMLTGERRLEPEAAGRHYRCIERAYGQFVRCVALPEDVTPDRVRAAFKDGVLRVLINRGERSGPNPRQGRPAQSKAT